MKRKKNVRMHSKKKWNLKGEKPILSDTFHKHSFKFWYVILNNKGHDRLLLKVNISPGLDFDKTIERSLAKK